MITEPATITELDPAAKQVRVLVNSAKGCQACSQKAGCGTGLLERWINPAKDLWVSVPDGMISRLSVGEEVDLCVEETAFVKNSMLLYMVPLLLFIGGAGLGWQLGGDALSVICGIIGLALGAKLVSLISANASLYSSFAPQLQKKAQTAEPPTQGAVQGYEV